MAMAFLVFGKKRRDREPTGPDDELAANAARGAGLAPNASYAKVVVPNAAAVATAVQAAVAAPVAAGTSDVDGHMPRWRRPSLMEARKADPTRGIGAAAVSLRFTGDAGVAVDGMERRLIRYRMVSLLDLPDEVRGTEIGALDEGDEVVLLEKRGTYWRVLCPDGRQGWLHKMTLGDVVIDPSTQAATAGRPATTGRRSAGSRTSSAPTRRSGSSSATPSRPSAPPSTRRAAGALRSTTMCWWAMFGTNERGYPYGRSRVPAWYHAMSPLGTRPTASARAARSAAVNR